MKRIIITMNEAEFNEIETAYAKKYYVVINELINQLKAKGNFKVIQEEG